MEGAMKRSCDKNTRFNPMSEWPAGNTATEKRVASLVLWLARATISLSGRSEQKRRSAECRCTPLPAETIHRSSRAVAWLSGPSGGKAKQSNSDARQTEQEASTPQAARADSHGNAIAALPVRDVLFSPLSLSLSLPLSACRRNRRRSAVPRSNLAVGARRHGAKPAGLRRRDGGR
jgi:hypothetical protein